MKLAEALSMRSQLKGKVSRLRSRLDDCVKIQEGDDLTETPEQILAELDSTLEELRKMIYRINMTNTLTRDEEGRNITSLLAERDTIKERVNILDSALNTIVRKEVRYNRSEIRLVRTVDITEIRRIYDRTSAKLRKLDLHIQGLSFTTDLIEE